MPGSHTPLPTLCKWHQRPRLCAHLGPCCFRSTLFIVFLYATALENHCSQPMVCTRAVAVCIYQICILVHIQSKNQSLGNPIKELTPAIHKSLHAPALNLRTASIAYSYLLLPVLATLSSTFSYLLLPLLATISSTYSYLSLPLLATISSTYSYLPLSLQTKSTLHLVNYLCHFQPQSALRIVIYLCHSYSRPALPIVIYL